MTRVIAALIRHGDYHQLENTPSAWQPFPLTAAGKKHALDATDSIISMLTQQNCILYPVCDSSQLLRAWQTADIICHSLNNLKDQSTLGLSLDEKMCVHSFAALAERSVGSVANLSSSQIEEIIDTDPRFASLPKNWKSNSHYCLPLQGAESLMDSGKRVAAHLSKSLSELQNNVQQPTLKLFVGHGAAFRHAAYHLGVLEFAQIAEFSMFHGQPVFIEQLADGSWVHLSGKWKIRNKKNRYTD